MNDILQNLEDAQSSTAWLDVLALVKQELDDARDACAKAEDALKDVEHERDSALDQLDRLSDTLLARQAKLENALNSILDTARKAMK